MFPYVGLYVNAKARSPACNVHTCLWWPTVVVTHSWKSVITFYRILAVNVSEFVDITSNYEFCFFSSCTLFDVLFYPSSLAIDINK